MTEIAVVEEPTIVLPEITLHAQYNLHSDGRYDPNQFTDLCAAAITYYIHAEVERMEFIQPAGQAGPLSVRQHWVGVDAITRSPLWPPNSSPEAELFAESVVRERRSDKGLALAHTIIFMNEGKAILLSSIGKTYAGIPGNDSSAQYWGIDDIRGRLNCEIALAVMKNPGLLRA